VCRDCCDAIREAAAATRNDPIAAMSISCQGEAFTPIGPNGEMLGNGMVSSDARAVEIVSSFGRQFGVERLYERTGHTPHPMFTLFKMLWLQQNRPDVYQTAKQFFCYEDLFHTQLGVEPAINWPLAGRTMFFNVHTHAWDPEILEAIRLDPARLAKPLPSGSIVGVIPSAIAKTLGLPDNVLVVTGGHDQPAGALGAGAVEAGEAMYASGTVECICPAFEQLRLDPRLSQANLCSYDFTIPGMATTILFSLTGGNLLRWFRDQWGQPELAEAARSGVDVYELLTQAMATEPTNLLVLPYFTPSGTPYFDPEVPGAVLGLRLTTTRSDVLRALIEGVAMEMRLNLDILEQCDLPVRQLCAIGGGAKSRVLVQLKADVMNRPIRTLEVTEAACLGVAMLACAAHTKTSPRELAKVWAKQGPAIKPDARRAAYYTERFAAYRGLYPAIRDFWQRSVAGKKS
jgi:xylulokinase